MKELWKISSEKKLQQSAAKPTKEKNKNTLHADNLHVHLDDRAEWVGGFLR